MKFKSLIMRFGPNAEVKLDAEDVAALILSGVSDEVIVTGNPKTTHVRKTCDVFHVQISNKANIPDCVMCIQPNQCGKTPGWSAVKPGKSLFDVLEELNSVTEIVITYDDGTETKVTMPYDIDDSDDESNEYQQMARLPAGLLITVDKNRKPETKTKASPVKISVTPNTDANGNSLQDYKIKVFFPALNYTHEETFIGTNLSDAETAANFIARAVARELKASLDDVIETSW